MEEFFCFGAKLTSNYFRAHIVESKNKKDEFDNEWNLFHGTYSEIDFPVIFHQDEGKTLGDLIETGWISLFLISDQLKNILEKNSLSGWKTFPIKLYDKKNNEVLGYSGFSITGRSAAVDYTKSEIIEKRHPTTGVITKYFKGMHIEEWDNTDFFLPEKYNGIIITKKVADVLLNNEITNFYLENLEDCETRVKSILNKK